MEQVQPQSAENYFPRDSFRLPWAVFWLVTITCAVLLWLSFFRPPPITAPPRSPDSAGYDWFFMLRMPEVPRDATQANSLKQHYREWIPALLQAGYQPMLLSDVHRRIDQGYGLPRNAVVLVFQPGYNHTYEEVAPLLVESQVPALWVTDRTAVSRGDRHFVHRRRAKWMVRSGYWDLAYSGGTFWKKDLQRRDFKINESQSAAWAPSTGRTALNWSGGFSDLQYLDVNPKWSAEELVQRLAMERPLHGTVGLGVRLIQNSLWGVVYESPKESPAFHLRTPLTATSSTLYWLGTRGAANLETHLQVNSFFGQNFLWLRADVSQGQGVGVGFTHHKIFIDQRIHGTRHRLATYSWTPPQGRIDARIQVTGSRIRVAAVGAPVLETILLPDTVSRNAMVRYELFDRVQGAARADAVRIEVTALHSSPRPR